ncbi:MAG: hypothetical protein V4559_01510 [Pseudomonadota bacterium]
MDDLVYWGPTLVPLIVILLAFGLGMRRQAQFFKAQAENSVAQTAELRKIGQSLERLVSFLEKRKDTQTP